MGQYKTEAILLVVRDWGDADRMVTLFSREYGKISAMAYGARRPKSMLSGSTQPFIHAEMALAAGKSMDSVKQCEIKRSFREIREDLVKMAYANFLAELVVELWPEREADPAVFDLLLAAFNLIGKRNPRLTALACALQLLSLAGFRPEFGQCVVCGQAVNYPARFSATAGGSVCTACAQPHLLECTAETIVFIDRLLSLNWREPGEFTVTGAVLMQAEKLLADFITCRLDKPLKSMAFIAAVT
jgi:DNA repair protein RecO (recombination protein O)